MPSRNTIRDHDTHAYYHVYNRGAGKQPIFLDEMDRYKFLDLLCRHLDKNDTRLRSDGKLYPKYDIELLAYCLMGNHFHMLVYQKDSATALTDLMKSVMTAYSMYFNLKYKGSGHVFQGPYKSARITSDEYLMHITRYIHMNPRYYLRYKWSSIGAYLGDEPPVWLQTERIFTMNSVQYRQFLLDYDGNKAALKELKHQLAL